MQIRKRYIKTSNIQFSTYFLPTDNRYLRSYERIPYLDYVFVTVTRQLDTGYLKNNKNTTLILGSDKVNGENVQLENISTVDKPINLATIEFQSTF